MGPWPRCAAEAVKAFADENLQQGSAAYMSWLCREDLLRQRLAELVGAATKDDIALLKNTTEGISLVAFGLDWRPGDNIVLPLDEFPSNRLPWAAQRDRGVELREVDIRAADDAEAALLGAMDRDTRLLAVSSVQWSDGFRLDLERLGEACRRKKVLFFVDAIQQLGALPLDAEACRIDFLAADGHKWLLAPEGIAVFYAREGVRQQLALSQQGWHMVDNALDFDRTQWAPSETARRFEAGSPNTLGQTALCASAGLLLERGMERVGQRVLANTRFLRESLGALPGITLLSPGESHRRSGIVSFRHVGVAAGELYRRLTERGVSCALRGGAVRISPHFYQGEAVLAEFIELLESALADA